MVRSRSELHIMNITNFLIVLVVCFLGVKVGDRVVWLRESPHCNEAGKVKWIGIIEHEEIAGIEFVSND